MHYLKNSSCHIALPRIKAFDTYWRQTLKCFNHRTGKGTTLVSTVFRDSICLLYTLLTRITMQESIVDFHGYFTRLIYLKRSRDSICVTCFIHVNWRGSPCRSLAYVDFHGYFTRLTYLKRSRDSICVDVFYICQLTRIALQESSLCRFRCRIYRRNVFYSCQLTRITL